MMQAIDEYLKKVKKTLKKYGGNEKTLMEFRAFLLEEYAEYRKARKQDGKLIADDTTLEAEFVKLLDDPEIMARSLMDDVNFKRSQIPQSIFSSYLKILVIITLVIIGVFYLYRSGSVNNDEAGLGQVMLALVLWPYIAYWIMPLLFSMRFIYKKHGITDINSIMRTVKKADIISVIFFAITSYIYLFALLMLYAATVEKHVLLAAFTIFVGLMLYFLMNKKTGDKNCGRPRKICWT